MVFAGWKRVIFFSTSISPYLYLFSKVEALGLFFGFNPLKISLTYISATLLGVPLILSSNPIPKFELYQLLGLDNLNFLFSGKSNASSKGVFKLELNGHIDLGLLQKKFFFDFHFFNSLQIYLNHN